MYDPNGNAAQLIEMYKPTITSILKERGDTPFLVGDYPTYIDFYFFELLECLNTCTFGHVLTDFPNLSSYQLRIKGLKGLQEYFADPNCYDAQLDFNNVCASMNGKGKFH